RSLEDWRARVRSEVERLAETFSELDFAWTPPLVDDVQAVTAAMLDPGPFLTYCHGQPCPGSARILFDSAAGMPRALFFHFAFGGLGHALVDAMFPRMAFATSWSCGVVPPRNLARCESAYRSALAMKLPAAEDS